jgi:hypothetical protein
MPFEKVCLKKDTKIIFSNFYFFFKLKFKKKYSENITYNPGEWANVAEIRNGSVSFVLPVIIINTRFQLVHAI